MAWSEYCLEHRVSSDEVNMPHGSVLVLQADLDSREMYAESLRQYGLDPIIVTTATEALAAASKVDIMVTGLLLPGDLDGFGLIDRLKTDPATHHLPVIVLTCCGWSSSRARAERAGCDLFLAKPCLPDDLAREVCRLLGTSADGRAAQASPDYS